MTKDLPAELQPSKYLEVDYQEVTRRKAAIISKHPELHLPLSSLPSTPSPNPLAPSTSTSKQGSGQDGTPPLDHEDEAPHEAAAGGKLGGDKEGNGGADESLHIDTHAGEVVTSRYSLLPVDLRDLEGLTRAVERAGLSWTRPTYILSECVLVYMVRKGVRVGGPDGVKEQCGGVQPRLFVPLISYLLPPLPPLPHHHTL